MTHIVTLDARRVIEVAGADRVSFLQGLVSNDVKQVVSGTAVWAALLTPQGKWLADFFILADGDRLLLDCERDQVGMLVQRLTKFRMRAKVTIAETPLAVHAAWDGAPDLPPGCIAAADPRLPEAGWRILSPDPLSGTASFAAWDAHRLALGLPDGSRDMETEKSTLLEAGFDELHGVSWTKGCYMGQELTARTKYRGLIKRRLVPVRIDGTLPAPGTPVSRDGQEVGSMRSGAGETGLAHLRLDALDARLSCGEAVLTPRTPAWMNVPQTVTT